MSTEIDYANRLPPHPQSPGPRIQPVHRSVWRWLKRIIWGSGVMFVLYLGGMAIYVQIKMNQMCEGYGWDRAIVQWHTGHVFCKLTVEESLNQILEDAMTRERHGLDR